MREERQLGIRKLAPEDAVHLRVWLNDERVLTYYEGRDRPHDDAMIRANFFPEDDEGVSRFLVLFGEEPIGYVQYYPVDSQDKLAYGYSPMKPSTAWTSLLASRCIGTRDLEAVSSQA